MDWNLTGPLNFFSSFDATYSKITKKEINTVSSAGKIHLILIFLMIIGLQERFVYWMNALSNDFSRELS